MFIREITGDEFKNFTYNFKDKSIYQTIEYGEVMHGQDYEYMFLGLIDGVTIVAASMLLLKKISNFRYAFAPRGFLLDYSNQTILGEFTREIKKFLGKKEIIAVKLCPMIIKNIFDSNKEIVGTNDNYNNIFNNLKTLGYYHFGYNSFFEAYKPRYEAILPLTTNYALLFKNISKQYKTKIRGAEKKGIRIYRAKADELNVLYEQTKKKYVRDTTYFNDSFTYFDKTNSIDYYYAKLDTKIYLELCKESYEKLEDEKHEINEEVMKNADKNSHKLISKKISIDHSLAISKNQLIEATNYLRDYPNGVILASTLIIRQFDEVNVYIDGFDSNFKNLNAKHLLMWKLVEKYSKLGFKNFNFGGATNITVENKKYQGLNEFKLGFNCNIVEYMGDLELVTNNTLYFMYQQSQQLKKILKK